MFPRQHFAVSVLCNRSDAEPDRLGKAVAEIYLAEQMRRTGKKSALSEDESAAGAGRAVAAQQTFRLRRHVSQ